MCVCVCCVLVWLKRTQRRPDHSSDAANLFPQLTCVLTRSHVFSSSKSQMTGLMELRTHAEVSAQRYDWMSESYSRRWIQADPVLWQMSIETDQRIVRLANEECRNRSDVLYLFHVGLATATSFRRLATGLFTHYNRLSSVMHHDRCRYKYQNHNKIISFNPCMILCMWFCESTVHLQCLLNSYLLCTFWVQSK